VTGFDRVCTGVKRPARRRNQVQVMWHDKVHTRFVAAGPRILEGQTRKVFRKDQQGRNFKRTRRVTWLIRRSIFFAISFSMFWRCCSFLCVPAAPATCRVACLGLQGTTKRAHLISNIVFKKSFCTSQLLHKSVNLWIILATVKKSWAVASAWWRCCSFVCVPAAPATRRVAGETTWGDHGEATGGDHGETTAGDHGETT
jgi:hypothetical protein